MYVGVGNLFFYWRVGFVNGFFPAFHIYFIVRRQ